MSNLTPSGGCLTNRLISANTTNSTLVKGAPGLVLGLQVSNVNAAVRFLKLYNKVTAPTVGTDTPFMTILLQASSVPQNIRFPDNGIYFSAGIGLGLTTLVADNDTNAVAAAEIVINLFYL